MKRTLLLIPLAVALAALAGCSGASDDAALTERIQAVQSSNLALNRKLDALVTDLEPLAEQVHRINEDNRRLTRTLADVEDDLRAQLVDMIRAEGGSHRGPFRGREAAAVPAVEVKPRPYLGFDAQAISAVVAERLRLDDKAGIVVTDVREGAPAEAGGLKKDDVVVRVDGAQVASKGALAKVVSAKKPGDPVTFGLLRDGKKMELTITLGRR